MENFMVELAKLATTLLCAQGVTLLDAARLIPLPHTQTESLLRSAENTKKTRLFARSWALIICGYSAPGSAAPKMERHRLERRFYHCAFPML